MSDVEIFVVVDREDGDRPYVSTSMSLERLDLARRAGWVVTKLVAKVRDDGVVSSAVEREVLVGPR